MPSKHRGKELLLSVIAALYPDLVLSTTTEVLSFEQQNLQKAGVMALGYGNFILVLTSVLFSVMSVGNTCTCVDLDVCLFAVQKPLDFCHQLT